MDLKGKGGALFVPVPVGGRDIGHLSLQIQPKRMQYPRNIEEQAKNVVDEEIITCSAIKKYRHQRQQYRQYAQNHFVHLLPTSTNSLHGPRQLLAVAERLANGSL